MTAGRLRGTALILQWQNAKNGKAGAMAARRKGNIRQAFSGIIPETIMKEKRRHLQACGI